LTNHSKVGVIFIVKAAKMGLMVTAAYPLLWLAVFYAFVLRARFALGHWPLPYRPDPKIMGFDLHHKAIWLGLVAMPFFLVMSVLGAAMGRKKMGLRVTPLLATACFGALAVIILARFDPGEFFEWFAD
jgi:hypothetical protein